MKVLVTGAAGFIGRQLVPVLAAAGHAPRVLLRSLPREAGADRQQAVCALFGPQLALPSGELFIGTLPDRLLATRLCAGIDAVIHAAGVAHVNADAEALRRANLDGAVELARIAKEQGVRRFLFLSSSKARYPRHSAYARLKAEAETELRKLHEAGSFDVICLRPALVYGRGMQGNLRSLLRVLARPWLPAFPGSTQPMGMISVQDLCRALVTVMEAEVLPDRIWELADGQAYTLTGLVRDVRGALGLPPPLLTLPRPLFRLLAALAPFFGSSLSLSTYRTLFEETYAQNTSFNRHTGFAAEDTFRARLPELLQDL